jgi:C4-dicarboxylate-specific signal transduction histidine kinase
VRKTGGLETLRNRVGLAAVKYGIAAVAVTLALLITQSLQPTVFPTPLFFAAIVVSTWFGGIGPGVFAVISATLLLDYYFVSSTRTFSAHPAALLYLAQFSFPALLSSWFVKKRKDAEQALKEARDHLDLKVQQRTAELREANLQLQSEIAERQRAEEAFHKTQANLAHVTRVMTMSELATSIAHEVNQPLAAIVTTGDACARWLTLDPPNLVRARESVARIISEGSRASEVVKRIRGLSKKTTFQKLILHLNELIHEVIALLDVELAKNKIRVRTELDPGLPSVLGDRVQLQQVVLNLIVNGIEAMSELADRPRALSVKSQKAGPDRVQVSIQDWGCGIEPDQVEHLFEAFFTTKPGGIGMGLSISRTIVESHGGRLWATANPSGGATFHFELPIAEEGKL